MTDPELRAHDVAAVTVKRTAHPFTWAILRAVLAGIVSGLIAASILAISTLGKFLSYVPFTLIAGAIVGAIGAALGILVATIVWLLVRVAPLTIRNSAVIASAAAVVAIAGAWFSILATSAPGDALSSGVLGTTVAVAAASAFIARVVARRFLRDAAALRESADL